MDLRTSVLADAAAGLRQGDGRCLTARYRYGRPFSGPGRPRRKPSCNLPLLCPAAPRRQERRNVQRIVARHKGFPQAEGTRLSR